MISISKFLNPKIHLFNYLVFLILVLAFIFYNSMMYHVDLLGDEKLYYFDASKGLANIIKCLITLNLSDIPKIWEDSVIDNGFYLPGSSFFLSPIRLFTDSISVSRSYMGVLNYLLLFYIIMKIKRLHGKYAAGIFLVICVLNPTFNTFSFTFWGESLAGKFTLLLLLLLYDCAIKKNDEMFKWRNILMMALYLVIIIYCRHSYILLAPFTIFAILIMLFYKFNFQTYPFKRALKTIALITTIVSFFIFTWSYSVSSKYGCCFFTTTTIDIGFLSKMAPESFLDSLAKTGRPAVLKDQNLQPLHRYYVDLAEEKNVSYASLVKRDKQKFEGNYEFIEFAERKRNRYKQLINRYKSSFDRFSKNLDDKYTIAQNKFKVLKSADIIIWKLMLISYVLIFLSIGSTNLQNFDISVLLKLFLIAASLQLLIRFGAVRHFYGLLPLISYFLARLFTNFSPWKGIDLSNPEYKLNIAIQLFCFAFVCYFISSYYLPLV